MRILLTHSPEARSLYYGERALAALRQVGDVKLNHNTSSLEGEDLIKAAEDCDLIVSYRQSPGPAAVFERLPRLVAFLRCAIDIRNVDVAAASKAGVLVTRRFDSLASQPETSFDSILGIVPGLADFYQAGTSNSLCPLLPHQTSPTGAEAIGAPVHGVA